MIHSPAADRVRQSVLLKRLEERERKMRAQLAKMANEIWIDEFVPPPPWKMVPSRAQRREALFMATMPSIAGHEHPTRR